ncbi:MAG: hydroxyacid dehydrogenase [Microbacterium sp.]|uniref:hydroxyacid dehydrogenase n=1 Tax=Microbacterium sp. TaxID=51671 RepID=UPI003F808AD9
MRSLDIVLDLPKHLEQQFFPGELHARLQSLGTLRRVVDSGEGLSDPRMGGEVLITGWGTKLLPAHRRPGDSLRLITHSAGTIRGMVPKELIEDGVRVTQAAAGLAPPVAELAMAFTISLLRNLHITERMMQERSWAKAMAVPTGHSLAGTRVGVIGASRVGQAYIRLALAAGAQVSVYDPYLTDDAAQRLGVRLVGLDELLSTSLVVAVHAPVTEETRGLLDATRLALIPDNGVLINTARSAIIDTQALISELASGRISAGVHVYHVRPQPPHCTHWGGGPASTPAPPLPSESPLWGLPNVILTPHIGGITREAQLQQGTIVVEEIERFVSGSPLKCEITADLYDILA